MRNETCMRNKTGKRNKTGRLKREEWRAMRELLAPQAVEAVGPAREEETSSFAVQVPYLYGINPQNNGVARQ